MAAHSSYSGTALSRKLGIAAGARVAVLSCPEGFCETLGEMPDDVVVRTEARGNFDVMLFFVTRQAELVRRFPVFERRLEPAGGLWIAWPKKTSGVASDLSFDVVQRIGLDCGLVDNKVAAIDQTWSGLRFVRRKRER